MVCTFTCDRHRRTLAVRIPAENRWHTERVSPSGWNSLQRDSFPGPGQGQRNPQRTVRHLRHQGSNSRKSVPRAGLERGRWGGASRSHPAKVPFVEGCLLADSMCAEPCIHYLHPFLTSALTSCHVPPLAESIQNLEGKGTQEIQSKLVSLQEHRAG